MADSRRADAPAAPVDPADRESRAEALLVEGLDQYFAGRYDEAIHIWTRVLFFDRAHARARAYIDRARTALAERQRRGDQLLAETAALLDAGETDAARGRFAEAIGAAGEDERVSALRVRLDRQERLDRLDRGLALPLPIDHPVPPAPAIPGWNWPRHQRAVAFAGLAVVAVAVVAGAAVSPMLQPWLGLRGRPDSLVGPTSVQPWPVLSSAEVALVRARTLRGNGRLAEALVALDRVGRDSPVSGEADRLRAQIQAMLLAGGPERFRPKVDR
jgi:tetratricopeptide (TPR) repeat protein